MPSSSQTVRAIVMMCLASLCFTLNDTITKFLILDYDTTVIILLRSLLALPLLVILAIVTGGQRVRWSTRPGFHALRGAVNLLAAYLYIRGLEFLSVAEATVIVFASPVMVTAGSVLFFGETVGLRKWLAVAVSFLGVIIALRPGAGAFQPASLLILASAVLYALNSLTARWIPPEDGLWTVSFLGAAFSALFVALPAARHWVPVDPADAWLFAGAAVCSSLGIGLGALAYRSALASDLAPFGYSGLVWSIAVTWLVWGHWPDLWVVAGGLLIASSSVMHFAAARRPGPERAGGPYSRLPPRR